MIIIAGDRLVQVDNIITPSIVVDRLLFFDLAAAGSTSWAGKIYGVTPGKIMGVSVSNISKVGGN